MDALTPVSCWWEGNFNDRAKALADGLANTWIRGLVQQQPIKGSGERCN